MSLLLHKKATDPAEKAKSGIKIKAENKGKFTATKKKTGKSTEELKHSKNPLTRKRATFSANAKKWAKKRKKDCGGLLRKKQDGGAIQRQSFDV